MEILANIIRTHPFWKGLNPEHFRFLEVNASLMRFGLAEPIFVEDSDAEHFYLIHQGRISLETFVRGKGVVTIQSISTGGVLGWSWLFPPYRWHFGARSHAITEVVAFTAQALREHAKANHDFGYELTTRIGKVMLERLQATRSQLVDYYSAIEG